MTHDLLVADVMDRLQNRFVPEMTHINKRIEALIQQEYLERDKKDQTVYHYLI